MAAKRNASSKTDSTANLGFEATALRVIELVRCGARKTAKGSLEGDGGGVHQFGVPPKGNADFAWVQHFIHHLAAQGMAGVDSVCHRFAPAVLANGSMSSNQSGDCPARSASSKPQAKPQSLPRQRDICRALLEADLVDCMVALPS